MLVTHAKTRAHPFLKWAGGKRQLLPQLRRFVPQDFDTYYEPFLGGGALFFDRLPRKAVLSDINERLVRTYRAVRDEVDGVISILKRYRHDKHVFLRLRRKDIDVCPDAEVAAWMIYLNRTAYNGLYRVNKSNRFNTPFGEHKNPCICDEENLRACSAALRDVSITFGSFELVTENAQPGDFVYFDPPYVPVAVTSSFRSYTAAGFDHAAQVRLSELAIRLVRRGVHVLLSNSCTDVGAALYSSDHFDVRKVPATRRINCKSAGRGVISEFLIRGGSANKQAESVQ
jgi:DNA adenine methylase